MVKAIKQSLSNKALEAHHTEVRKRKIEERERRRQEELGLDKLGKKSKNGNRFKNHKAVVVFVLIGAVILGTMLFFFVANNKKGRNFLSGGDRQRAYCADAIRSGMFVPSTCKRFLE